MTESTPSADSAGSGKPPQLRLFLTIDAWICLLAGLGMGLLALSGPLAVWLGLADFRFGFGTLQMVNSWANWIAGGALIVAVLILGIAQLRQISGGPGLAGLALLGSVVAGLAWYVPQTFRPAEGTPAIHDIATDPYRPLQFEAIAPLRANAPNNMEYGVMDNNENMTVREHIRLQQEAYPDITPQVFDESVAAVFQRALAAAQSLGWEIVAEDVNSGRIEATDTTFWFRFKDDIVIDISMNRDGEAVLNARSLSRVGLSDVGKNAARLREFFSLL